MDIYEKLEQLKKLLDERAITHEEYEREKAKLLFPPVSSPGQPAWDLRYSKYDSGQYKSGIYNYSHH